MNRTACKINLGRIQVLSRCKPALLVKLAVVGQVNLWHNAQQLSTLQHSCTVVQQTVDYHRQTNNHDDVELAGEIKQFYHTILGMIQQELLFKQILTRIARDAKLGEHHHLNTTILGLSYQALNLLHIILYIGHFDRGHSSCYVYKSVFHSFTFCTSFSMSV